MENNLEKLSDNDDKAINYSSRKFVKNVFSKQGHRSRERRIIEKDKTVDLSKPNLYSFPGLQAILKSENTKSFKPSPKVIISKEHIENKPENMHKFSSLRQNVLRSNMKPKLHNARFQFHPNMNTQPVYKPFFRNLVT